MAIMAGWFSMKAPKIFMVSFLYIVYEHLLAFRGPTRSGYYGGMILAKSSEDFHGFFLYVVYGRLCGFLLVYLSASVCSLFQVRHPLAIMAG